MLGMTLRTHQTAPRAAWCRLLIEQGVDRSRREMYLAIAVDRGRGRPVFMASTQGGMDIEEVAAQDPKAILKEAVDPALGFQALPGAQARVRSRAAPAIAQAKAWRSSCACTGPSRARTPRSSRSIRS